MYQDEIYRIKAPYREAMPVLGYRFGKGEKAACILGPVRGNEIQQLYICSQMVKTFRELENNGCISAGKEILVIPVVNRYSLNIGKRFWGDGNVDLNRRFPGNPQGDATERITAAVMDAVREYAFGIQFASFYMSGEFVPHVRMMETGYQNASLANLFGLPYVVVRRPKPIDTKTLNYNWQNAQTSAFSVYTNQNDRLDDQSARQAVAAVLRFLTRMGIIRYECHSGYISHVLQEEQLTGVHVSVSGIYRRLCAPGEEVRYGQPIGEVIDPFEGHVREQIVSPTDGIVFFAHTEPLVREGEIVYRLIHRLHG